MDENNDNRTVSNQFSRFIAQELMIRVFRQVATSILFD